VPLIGGVVTEANVGNLAVTRGNDGAHDLGNKVNWLKLIKYMMLKPYEVANFNTMILSHCAISNIEMPVTVVAPFVH
jgi:hypothetical protein|tara:strand:+ start:372 stop:602 length:231 start_codon:yes stop_codon:yes gene_type:complete